MLVLCLIAVLLLLQHGGSNAFAPVRARLCSNSVGLSGMQQAAVPPVFEGVAAPVQSYVDFWVVLYKQLGVAVPPPVLHWGHGGAMATVILAMVTSGAFLGYKIRAGEGESTSNPITLGKSVRSQHPLIMGLATLFFLTGGQGGLVLLAVQGKPILESPHALTAVAGLGLLAVQALLPLSFNIVGKPSRDAHMALGTATLGVLAAHAASGVSLGLSF